MQVYTEVPVAARTGVAPESDLRVTVGTVGTGVAPELDLRVTVGTAIGDASGFTSEAAPRVASKTNPDQGAIPDDPASATLSSITIF